MDVCVQHPVPSHKLLSSLFSLFDLKKSSSIAGTATSDGRYRYQSIDTSDSSVSFVGIDNSMPYCCKTIRYFVCRVP